MRLKAKYLGYVIAPAAFFFVVACSANAQTRQPIGSSTSVESSSRNSTQGGIRGRIVLPDGGTLTENAKVTLQNMRGADAGVFSDSQGHFEFARLAPGSYQLVVEADRQRFEVSTENVEVVRSTPVVVTIVLKEKTSTQVKHANGVVNTGELDPKVPAAAKKEYELGRVASNQGHPAEAIVHFRKATVLYPGYLTAHNDLGTQLLAQGKLVEAEEEFQQALELAPKAFNPLLNLGMVQVHQQRFPEAVQTLQKALAEDPNSPAARLYFGMALAGSEDSAGAERELKAAYERGGDQYAVALYHLGMVLMNRGETDNAVKMFESYLQKAPDAANANAVRSLIGTLR